MYIFPDFLFSCVFLFRAYGLLYYPGDMIWWNIKSELLVFSGQSLIKIGQCWLQHFEARRSHTGPWLVETDHVTWILDSDWSGRISQIILAVINYQLLFWYCESLGAQSHHWHIIALDHETSQHQTRTHYSDLLALCFEVLDKSICIYPRHEL